MQISAVLPADRETLVRVQPGERALHDPSDRAQPRAMRCTAAADHWAHPPLAQQSPILVMVIAPVAQHRVGLAPRRARLAAYRRDGVQQGDELGDVVAVAASDRDRQRDAIAVG
jgi:hypothetical protein